MRAAPWLVVMVFASACGASVGDVPGDALAADSALDAAIDAPPIDARACAGGNAAMVADDGSCLVRFDTALDFAGASAACTTFGSTLAILNSAARDATARILVGGGLAFIGLSDAVSEMTFVWVDGSGLAFENFADLEPNDAAGAFPEDCVVFDGLRNGWDDRPCVAGFLTPGVYPYLCMF